MPEIAVKDLLAAVKAAIRAKYDMNVHEFSESEWPTNLGIPGGNTLRCYLQGASVSFPVFKVLAAHFNLGTLKKRTVIVHQTVYEIQKREIIVPVPRRILPRTASSPRT